MILLELRTKSAKQPTAMVLTKAELLREAEALAVRIARANLPLHDADIVIALAERLRVAK